MKSQKKRRPKSMRALSGEHHPHLHMVEGGQTPLPNRHQSTAILFNRGIELERLRQFAAAGEAYRRCLVLDPTDSKFHHHLGKLLLTQGQTRAALDSLKQAVALTPGNADMLCDLSNAWQQEGQLDEAQVCLRRAINIRPSFPSALNNLGVIQLALGQLHEAQTSFRAALAAEGESPTVASNLLFCMTNDEAVDPGTCFEAHRDFSKRFERPLAEQGAVCKIFLNNHQFDRPLRVGFVSGDLRKHAVAHFMLPVWQRLNPQMLQLWAYANHPQEDEFSDQLRACVRQWRNVSALSDAALVDQIRADRIDVLIDLSGHSARNRMLVFARRAAPVQACWLGYSNTTGLDAMDYAICDRFNAPPGLFEHYWVERFVRLPSAVCFAPLHESPPVNELPAIHQGHITFGSFHQIHKLGESVLATWAEVLGQVRGARLLLGNVGDAELKNDLIARLEKHGVSADRIEFEPKLSIVDYLALHHRVDIILDAWPYSGGTTTYHALSMGVPVVTLRGPSRAHCNSAGILGRLGLADWIADDVPSFVRIAVEKANSLATLAVLRATMRQRWVASPWCNPELVARGLEAALRVMWQRWCAGEAPAPIEIGWQDAPKNA